MNFRLLLPFEKGAFNTLLRLLLNEWKERDKNQPKSTQAVFKPHLTQLRPPEYDGAKPLNGDIIFRTVFPKIH